MAGSLHPARLDRRDPYAFLCGRCSRCCSRKLIQVNPYEVARLAGRLGLTTTTFIRRHTVAGGAYLKFSRRQTCPFLTKLGCGVHPDRPLVCRLYPLGRHVSQSGEEWFTELATDPACAGRRLARASVHAYLRRQGALPFMRAADRYLALYWALAERLDAAEADPRAQTSASSPWADLDAALARYCRQTRIAPARSIEGRMRQHIRAIQEWADLPRRSAP